MVKWEPADTGSTVSARGPRGLAGRADVMGAGSQFAVSSNKLTAVAGSRGNRWNLITKLPKPTVGCLHTKKQSLYKANVSEKRYN
jgi:hypothetical protein